MENKEQFVSDFQEALIKNGAGRYDWLMDTPIRYEEVGCSEVLVLTWRSEKDNKYCVTGDSLTALAATMLKAIE